MFPKKRILIVDDEADLVESLKVRLQSENYDVIVAYDGEDGFKKAKNENPDAIILDVMLPKMSGYDVCRKIRKDKEIPEIPIIILTARRRDEDKLVEADVGADVYISKPFDIGEILVKIKWLLS